MKTIVLTAVLSCFAWVAPKAAANDGFLSSDMYCKDAYLELKSKAAQQEDIDLMARSCQAQHEKNLMHAEWEKQDAAERLRISRLPGPAIGMPADKVVRSTSWGAPLSKNRTITAAGTSEQWVYGGGNYLYFKNGRLHSIQN